MYRLRNNLEYTQAEFAARAGMSLSTYRRIETGTDSNPPIRYLANIAIALDIPPDFFFKFYAVWWSKTDEVKRPDPPTDPATRQAERKAKRRRPAP